jgi:ATP-binding cassette subfamily G (WHITE) protein 2 (SNQ2)
LLRQLREVPKEEKYAYVETIIDLLEKHDNADAIIGKVGEGLSAEQRKRLTVGVELASKPELLFFLDEATICLDSGVAFSLVRSLAESHRRRSSGPVHNPPAFCCAVRAFR